MLTRLPKQVWRQSGLPKNAKSESVSEQQAKRKVGEMVMIEWRKNSERSMTNMTGQGSGRRHKIQEDMCKWKGPTTKPETRQSKRRLAPSISTKLPGQILEESRAY